MDHVPLPSPPAGKPPYTHIAVPYLCSEPYDLSPFEGYPDRHGWRTLSFLCARFDQPGKKWHETAAVLQNWLWFGMLSEFLRLSDIPAGEGQRRVGWLEDEFVTPGGAVLTTAKLPGYLKMWRAGYLKLGRAARMAYLGRVGPMFQTTAEAGTIVYYALWAGEHGAELRKKREKEKEANLDKDDEAMRSSTAADDPPWPLPYEVVLAINILGHNLSAVLMEANLELDIDFHRTGWSPTSKNRDPMVARMLANGWCRNDVTRLEERFHCVSIYYASFVQRKLGRYDHGACTWEECMVNHVDEAVYKTRHVVEGCGCEFVGPDVAEVERVLERGKVPLVTLKGAQGGTVEVGVFEYDGLDDYVALSHVWSDGLGNVSGNTLPTCQLRRLMSKLEALTKCLPTWEYFFPRLAARVDQWLGQPRHYFIDTLCVPTSHRYRRLAIGKMHESYKNANRVLVLDSELEAISIQGEGGVSREEAMLRVACSSWMRRMWTLQEALFARQLYVTFQDGFLNVGAVTLELMEKGFGAEVAYQCVQAEVAHALLPVVRRRWKTKMDERNAWEVMGALRGRTASKAGDVPVCLASLLGVDVARLYDVPERERMREALRLYGKVPGGLLFHEGERMAGNGNRWIPLTMGQKFSPDWSLGVPGVMGLKVKYPGFVVETPKFEGFTRRSEKAEETEDRGGALEVTPFRLFSLEDTRDPRRPRYKAIYGESRAEDDIPAFPPDAKPFIAIITASVDPTSRRRTVEAIQVIVYKEEGDVYFSYFDCTLSLELEISRDDKGSNWGFWLGTLAEQVGVSQQEISDEMPTLQGMGWKTKADQTWVVG